MPERWGREVERSTVDGHPCLVYTRRPRSVGELLLERRRWPDRELLVQGERRITGAELERLAARAAAGLRGRGVGPGHRVLLLGFNSVEWVVAFWALQSLGAVAALGNAWWSDAEAAEALAEVGPVLTITDRDLPGGVRLADLDGPDAELELHPVAEDDLALIMFSSGTTGAAKGVLMSHRSVVANIHNLLVLTGRLPDELPDTHPGTVSMLSVPLFHLAGIQTSITTMLSGGRLVFLEGRFDPGEVLRLIQQERVRVWGSIPTMVSRVLDHPGFAAFDTSSVSSVPMGGAAISPELRERVAASFPGVKARVGSLYGLTEAGGVLAAGSGADITSRPGAVGRALPVVELKIVESTGEIAARTPTMTGGYLNDPTPIVDAEGWVSSGDLGRIDDDGWLYVTGRSKDVIIRGGENIAAANVERALLTHPDVVEAAVVALPHADLGEEVGAAVVLSAAVDAHTLRVHAAGLLGRHELPTRWWFHPGPLPTNPSGKILRRQIREEWPVTTTDGYDLFSPDYRNDPAPMWEKTRGSGCPVAHTDAWGGSFMLTRFDDIRDAARNPGQFSSRAVEVAGPLESAGGLLLPPLTSDPPRHKPERDVLMPYFLPARTAAYEDFIRTQARSLAEAIAARGGGDAVGDYAEHLTLAVLTELLGVPPGGRFSEWMVRMIRIGGQDQAVRAEVVREIIAYLDGLLTERTEERGDDLISYLVDAEMDGVPLTRKHKLGSAFLVLIAGADTTWSAIGSSIWHLATHDDDRRRLLAEPALMATAVEEFLRAYAPVTVGRIATADAELHGRCVHAGERVILPFGAANRDPEVFDAPEEVQIDRRRNRHLTFGTGAHRCLGSNLARLELRIAIEEWLRVMPHFRLTDPEGIEWSGGQTRGPERVDVEVRA